METTKEKFLDLLTKQGVYGKLKCAYEEFYNFMRGESLQSIDLYCPKCRMNKTFICKNTQRIEQFGSVSERTCIIYFAYSLNYMCPTCRNNLWYILYYDRNRESVIKLAQYPTLYDVTPDELKKALD